MKYVILGIAGLAIAYGLMDEQQLEVLNKAIMICLECIGIG